jgi:hypothetical protein
MRVTSDGGVQKLYPLADRVLARIVSIEVYRAKVEVLGGAVCGPAEAERSLSGLPEGDAERLGDVACDVSLDLDLIGRRLIVGILPTLDAVAAAEQLRADAHHLRRAAYAASQDVGDAELGRDDLCIEILDRIRRCPSDHLQADASQRRAKLLGDALSEVSLICVAGEIVERKDRDTPGVGGCRSQD